VVILSTMLVLEFVYASNAKQITKMIITGIMDFPKSFESAVLTCLKHYIIIVYIYVYIYRLILW
jgi:uncharacterized membrane protein YhdT